MRRDVVAAARRRRGLPDLEPFIRFESSTIGRVYDARGTVLVELAREYRRVVSYDDVPVVLRHAILAAEDVASISRCGSRRGGSTLTQQLVRGYFLRDRSPLISRRNSSGPGTNRWPLDLGPIAASGQH